MAAVIAPAILFLITKRARTTGNWITAEEVRALHLRDQEDLRTLDLADTQRNAYAPPGTSAPVVATGVVAKAKKSLEESSRALHLRDQEDLRTLDLADTQRNAYAPPGTSAPVVATGVVAKAKKFLEESSAERRRAAAAAAELLELQQYLRKRRADEEAQRKQYLDKKRIEREEELANTTDELIGTMEQWHVLHAHAYRPETHRLEDQRRQQEAREQRAKQVDALLATMSQADIDSVVGRTRDAIDQTELLEQQQRQKFEYDKRIRKRRADEEAQRKQYLDKKRIEREEELANTQDELIGTMEQWHVLHAHAYRPETHRLEDQRRQQEAREQRAKQVDALLATMSQADIDSVVGRT